MQGAALAVQVHRRTSPRGRRLPADAGQLVWKYVNDFPQHLHPISEATQRCARRGGNETYTHHPLKRHRKVSAKVAHPCGPGTPSAESKKKLHDRRLLLARRPLLCKSERLHRHRGAV